MEPGEPGDEPALICRASTVRATVQLLGHADSADPGGKAAWMGRCPATALVATHREEKSHASFTEDHGAADRRDIRCRL